MRTVYKSTHTPILNLKTPCYINGKIARQPWARLWYFCRAIDSDHRGKVYILVPELLTLLNCSRATFYRWLKEGQEAGAFREYKRIDKHTERIILGGKAAVCRKLKITNWDSVTQVPLWSILGNSDIPLRQNRKKPKGKKLRQWTTLLQAYWMQHRSIEAAKKEETNRIRNKRKRRKPFKPKFRGANGQPTSQLYAGRNVFFSRRHLPTGASQEGIGESLGISECSVRRHLKGVERIQVMYKVDPLEGQFALFNAQETWEKSPIFERKGEYYRYGTNLYNLKFTQKSEFTQRLKYKFSLLLEEIPIEAIQWESNKDELCSPLFSSCYLSKHEILEKLTKKYKLDSLDKICIYIYWELKTKSFGKFRLAVKQELKKLKRKGRTKRV